MDSFLLRRLGQTCLTIGRRLPDDVFRRIRELGIESRPPTRRGTRAGRLHRLWHQLPPASPKPAAATPTLASKVPITCASAGYPQSSFQTNTASSADHPASSFPASTCLLSTPFTQQCTSAVNWANLVQIGCCTGEDDTFYKVNDVPHPEASDNAAPSQRGVRQSNLVVIDRLPFVQDLSKLFKVIYLNARSCCNKTHELCDFIHESNADVVFVTETWFKPTGDEVKMKELTPLGYDLFSCPRHLRGGGGIVIIYRESLKDRFSFTRPTEEFQSFELCKAQLHYADQGVTFLCLYRPPPSKKNKLKVSDFLNEFPQLLDQFVSTNTQVVLLGDFNFHWDSSTNSSVKSLKSLLVAHSMSQLIDVPTHEDEHTLDWLIVREDHIRMILDLHVSDQSPSDHFPISFCLDIKKPGLRNKRTVTSRALRRVDMSALKEDVAALHFSKDDPLTDYNKGLRDVMDKHAPLTTRRVTDRPSAPWLTLEVKAAKQQRRRAERQWRKSGLTVHRQIFAHHREVVKRLIVSAKTSYTSQQVQDCTSSKDLFRCVGRLTGREHVSLLPNCLPLAELPDAFCTFFVEKIDKIRAELDSSCEMPTFSSFEGTSMTAFAPVTETEIRKILAKTPKKSCSLDPMPAEFLFACIDDLIPIITDIINQSLLSGLVPESFKHAVVTPLLKKASLDANVFKNFRPVSNLPFLSKILEKVVLRQLLDHLTDWDLLEPFQSAYRANHSTETALLRVLNDLLSACDRGQVSVLSLLDLSAAFDTLDHKILLKRLHTTFGVSGTVLRWFESYLVGRTQSVIVDGHASKPATLNYGVPQGSVLGPVLFTMYVQPLSRVIRQFDMQYHMFADDTQLQQSVPPSHVSQLIVTIQNTIESVKKWMKINKLKMSDDKTEIIPIATDQKLKTFSDLRSVSLSDVEIEFARSVRNLGVYLDQSLSMENHINILCRAAYLELRRISHIRPYLTLNATKTLMSAFLLTRLDYCNSLLFGLPDTLIDRIQKAQNNAARVVLRKRKFDHAKPLLRQLHWLPIRARIKYKIAVLCYRSLHGLAPSYISELLPLYKPSKSLRSANAGHLVVPRIRLERYGKRSLSHAGPTVWNALPISLREAATLASFKIHLKTHLFNSYLLD